MAKDLRVDPVDLRQGGDHVDVHAEDLLSQHAVQDYHQGYTDALPKPPGHTGG